MLKLHNIGKSYTVGHNKLEVLNLAGCLRVTLNSLVVQGQADLASVARVFGISARTLHRRMSDRGWGFRELLAESRLALARQRLGDPSARVVDVAFEVGYSDPSHFTRAFRNWTGQTPAKYRATMPAQPAI